MCSSDRTRLLSRFAALEAVTVFLLIMFYIWRLRFHYPSAWILILVLVVLSHHARQETLLNLGFTWRTFTKAFAAYGALLALLTLGIVAAGLAANSTRAMSRDDVIQGLSYYFFWGLFQQYLLNGYFVNRLSEVFADRESPRVPLLAAALFSAAHAPNWFLMIVTLAGGYLCAKAYTRYRNLYFLGLAHGVVGFALYVVVPESIGHHFYVGPKWFSPR